ncbi:unnamed protein product, partial [Coregonus sp. 'balchen']
MVWLLAFIREAYFTHDDMQTMLNDDMQTMLNDDMQTMLNDDMQTMLNDDMQTMLNDDMQTMLNVAFIQSDTILEVLHFGEGGRLLQTESDIDLSLFNRKSASPHPENCRPILFQPPMLDFHEQVPWRPLIIPPGGNTSFDVLFLARGVFGVGIPNPIPSRLRPFIGARVPVVEMFSRMVETCHLEMPRVVEMFSRGGDLQVVEMFSRGYSIMVVEMFSSGGDLHLELPTDNHTAFIRIKTNAPNGDQFIILPVEVEVTSEMLDFGTLRSQDRPKQLNLHLLNSGTKDVAITSIRTTPSNEAVAIHFKAITLKAGESSFTKVASIRFDASKAQRPVQFSGKITVKVKERKSFKLEVPYQADVLQGYLAFDHTATLFHIRDSPEVPVNRPIFLTNTFSFAVRIHNVQNLSAPVLSLLFSHLCQVQNLSAPVLIPPHESRYVFPLFRPVLLGPHIEAKSSPSPRIQLPPPRGPHTGYPE